MLNGLDLSQHLPPPPPSSSTPTLHAPQPNLTLGCVCYHLSQVSMINDASAVLTKKWGGNRQKWREGRNPLLPPAHPRLDLCQNIVKTFSLYRGPCRPTIGALSCGTGKRLRQCPPEGPPLCTQRKRQTLAHLNLMFIRLKEIDCFRGFWICLY